MENILGLQTYEANQTSPDEDLAEGPHSGISVGCSITSEAKGELN